MYTFMPFALLVVAGQFTLGSGRLLPSVAAAIGLLGVILGAITVVRSGRAKVGASRPLACAATAAGIVSLAVGGLHAINSAGGFGTGNGLAGAIVATVLGVISITLGGVSIVRCQRGQPESP